MKSRFVIIFCIAVLSLASCSDDTIYGDNNTFSLEPYYEVMLGDTLRLPIPDGCGNLSTKTNSSNVIVSCPKDNEKGKYVMVLGKELGTGYFAIRNDDTNDELESSVKVISPFILLSFDNQTESMFNGRVLAFVLVANESKDCYVLEISVATHKYSDVPLCSGHYDIMDDGRRFAISVKGGDMDIQKEFSILSEYDVPSVLKKMPAIGDEPRYRCAVKVQDSANENDVIYAEFVYKGFRIPNNIIR